MKRPNNTFEFKHNQTYKISFSNGCGSDHEEECVFIGNLEKKDKTGGDFYFVFQRGKGGQKYLSACKPALSSFKNLLYWIMIPQNWEHGQNNGVGATFAESLKEMTKIKFEWDKKTIESNKNLEAIN